MILRVCLHLKVLRIFKNSVVYFIPSTGNRFGWPHYKSFCLLPFASLWTPPKGIKILYLFIKVNHQSSCVGAKSQGNVQPKWLPLCEYILFLCSFNSRGWIGFIPRVLPGQNLIVNWNKIEFPQLNWMKQTSIMMMNLTLQWGTSMYCFYYVSVHNFPVDHKLSN